MFAARKQTFVLLLLVTLIALTIISLCVGEVRLTWADLWNGAETARTILWQVRMPRIVLGMLAGAALATSGAMMQGLFRNPLADPSLIGVSAGAAMGAITGIVVGFIPVTLAAFAGGVGVTFIIYRISQIEGRPNMATMLLAGIAVNALAAAYIGCILVYADAEELRNYTFWTLGSLAVAQADWPSVLAAAALILPPIFVAPLFAKPLNAFLLGEAEAGHLGVDVHRVKAIVVFLGSAMVGASVAVCGTIGFVGLMVPHLVRLMLGPDHQWLLPGSALLGAILLILADTGIRMGIAGQELPIGVITALLGAPFFLFLLTTSRSRIWG